ncbi:MAG: peptide chain release factor N(5)-glutamine methyltransferase [Actinomycetota bacterium]|nr:peptide chain release factor N(5)-glutamine methyltransferase [Actinomycetota bacterium]
MQVLPKHEVHRLEQLVKNSSLSKEFDTNLYRSFLQRRYSGEPLQYIEEEVSFYDMSFQVNESVLIPRPETEYFIEKIIDRVYEPKKIIDVGTGSGCIGLSLAKHFTDAEVHLTDISLDALSVAGINSKKNKINVNIYESNLLREVRDNDFDLIVANLPYIPTADIGALPVEVVHYEPLIALDGGEDGLDYIDQLLKQARYKLSATGLLALEIDSRSGDNLIEMTKSYKGVEVITDLAGKDRYVFARK